MRGHHSENRDVMLALLQIDVHWLASARLLLKPTASSPITCNQYNLFISVHLSASIHTMIFLCSPSLQPFIWKCRCVCVKHCCCCCCSPSAVLTLFSPLPAPQCSPSSPSVHTCPSSLYWGKPFLLQRNICPPPFLPPIFWLLCADSPPTQLSFFGLCGFSASCPDVPHIS